MMSDEAVRRVAFRLKSFTLRALFREAAAKWLEIPLELSDRDALLLLAAAIEEVSDQI